MNLKLLRSTQGFALFVGVVVVVVLVFLFATGRFESDDDDDPLALPDDQTSEQESGGDDGDSQADAEGDGGSTDGAEGGPIGDLVALDETFQVGDLRLRITDSRFGGLVGENRDNVDAQGRFVIISITARNAGADPIALEDRVRLLDASGRSYSPVPEASATAAQRDPELADALAVELQPGLTVDLVLVFDVPEDAEGLLLRVGGGFVDVAIGD